MKLIDLVTDYESARLAEQALIEPPPAANDTQKDTNLSSPDVEDLLAEPNIPAEACLADKDPFPHDGQMPSYRRKQPILSDSSTPPFSTGMRVAIYHRVSTLDQDAGLARAELEAWAARQGGHVAIRIEESASGAWGGRPGLVSVLDAARRGEIDCVVCWKLDRWGRSALDVLANIQALADAGVRFVAVTQALDVKPDGDAMSRLMLTVLAAVAEFERDLIKERTHLGLAKARASGKRLGRPRANGPLPDEALAMRATGMSWSEIARATRCTVGVARLRAAEAKARANP